MTPDPEFNLDRDTEIVADLTTIIGILEKDKSVSAESTYRTGGGWATQIPANTKFWITEIVNDATTKVVTAYKYNYTADPNNDETVGRVSIGSMSDCNGAVSFKIAVNINKATTGLWASCTAGTEKLYFAGFTYDPTATSWHLLPIPVKRDKASDVLVTTNFVETDKGEWIVLDDMTIVPNSRLSIKFYSNTAIAANVDLPFILSVQGMKEA